MGYATVADLWGALGLIELATFIAVIVVMVRTRRALHDVERELAYLKGQLSGGTKAERPGAPTRDVYELGRTITPPARRSG